LRQVIYPDFIEIMKIHNQCQPIDPWWMDHIPILMLALILSVISTLQPQRVAAEPQSQPAQVDQPTKTPTEPQSARDYFNRSMRRYRQQDKQGTIADLDRAIRLQPNSVDAYNNRGIVKESIGDKTLSLIHI
jgi:hypothetical protein